MEKSEKSAIDASYFGYPAFNGHDELQNVSGLILRDDKGFWDGTAVLLKTNGEELAICKAKKVLGFLSTDQTIGGVWYRRGMKCDDKDKPLMQLQQEYRGWFTFDTGLNVSVQSPPGNKVGRVEIRNQWIKKQANTCQDANGVVIATFNREYRWGLPARTSFHSVAGQFLGSMMHNSNETTIEFSSECSPHIRIMMIAAAIMYKQLDRNAASASSRGQPLPGGPPAPGHDLHHRGMLKRH